MSRWTVTASWCSSRYVTSVLDLAFPAPIAGPCVKPLLWILRTMGWPHPAPFPSPATTIICQRCRLPVHTRAG